MGLPSKCSVLGVGISTTDYQGIMRTTREWIARRRAQSIDVQRAHYICVTSVHGIMLSTRNAEFKKILNGADIATPDGMPVVWALRSFGATGQQRVYGPTLMLKLCEEAAALNHRIYLYGGRPETLADLQNRIKAKFPTLQMVGAYSPPFRALTPEEDAVAVQDILESKADIVFVGISTPKQEKWMSAHVSSLRGTILIGVGAAFDFHAGRVKQAPPWMQRAGLEWFFRFAMEPGRLWRRYLFVTPLFLPLWALQKIGVLRYSNPQEST